ncbi:hypothetical protein TGDOM2_279410 [Toxoplasma gondii GAB2-2007-GAL-DOM2]|uniref:Uncharacterized protein n=6 Tax=Toxoplasma gondii TaxID=5811 RepID=V4YZG0_TOXGV|nr:hypothetical protein TGVEG_279410 [Toxoplasma gondii VEG]KFG38990.1 hypothetical protein TGDOM2_279410 [Toxoplasma gondii GAB2-2007-GAL-DOM2]KFG42562.1 hypothetical protein TGFOU_279410 [Toxoplasma gondii FOU]KFH01582.1 hypothetical protein TGVAND_279410 [Toxoplasma gondii VAND]PUA85407.1 hypothetical protein TGBR9_279410 [Toxoplasma gondii TgCATBr9]RQX74238.1 hypothetical protein TGCAST_279410 [Toxoplasma gondii CAST]
MQHRFRTLLPPAGGPARAPAADCHPQLHHGTDVRAPGHLSGGGPNSLGVLAVSDHTYPAEKPLGDATGQGSFLQCSMSGLIPVDAGYTLEYLRFLLTSSCSRMSPCFFLDRRSIMVKGREIRPPSELCPDGASPITPAARRTSDTTNYGVVVRSYVYPEELSGACLVRVTTWPADVKCDWQSMSTDPDIDLPRNAHDPVEGHSVDSPKFEEGHTKATDALPTAGGNQVVGISHNRLPMEQDVDVVVCHEAVTTGATGDFFRLLDLTEHQVECWKGDVYEFREGGEPDFSHSVFVCRVYTDTATTKEAYNGCLLVHVCARSSLSQRTSLSDLRQAAARMTKCLLKVRETLRPCVKLKRRHSLSIGESSLAKSPGVFPIPGDGRRM